jgi:hypothetical protein
MSNHSTMTGKNHPPSKKHKSAKHYKFFPASVWQKIVISCDIQMDAIIYEQWQGYAVVISCTLNKLSVGCFQ